MLRRVSLAGQLLALQLLIVLVVLFAVAAVSLAQAQAGFRKEEGRRVLSSAETAAGTHTVRLGLQDPTMRGPLAPLAEGFRDSSEASYVFFIGTDRTILAATDPSQVGRALDLHGSRVLQGRAWEGVVTDRGVTSVVAHVPVLNDPPQGNPVEIVGFVAVGANLPSLWESLSGATPNLLTYLGVASVLGVDGATISGLIELEEYQEVVRYVSRLGRSQARRNDEVTSRIGDPALAALSDATAGGVPLGPARRTDGVEIAGWRERRRGTWATRWCTSRSAGPTTGRCCGSTGSCSDGG